MATGPLRADSACENPLDPSLLQLVTVLDRQALEGLTEAAIARLDLLDGDTDIESVRSEDDITDEFSYAVRKVFGPGCEMSDAGENSEPNGGS